MTRTHSDMRQLGLFMAGFGILMATLIGCADFGSGPGPIVDDGGNGGGTQTVFFQAQILPIFEANCAGSLCHNPCGGGNGGGLCLVSYATLAASGAVVPGDAQNSRVIEYLEGRRAPRMPYGRLPLADTTVIKIRTWIDEGAKNN